MISLLRELAGILGRDSQNQKDTNWTTIENAVNNLQTQISKLVVHGDSSPQAAQASAGADGTDYGGDLKARLDAEYNKLVGEITANDQARQQSESDLGDRITALETNDYFYIRQSDAISYGSAGTIQQLPVNAGNVKISAGVTIGSNEILFPTGGKYIILGMLDYSGLNDLETAELLIREFQDDGVTYSDDTHAVLGYTGAGGNATIGGIPVLNLRGAYIPVGGKAQFFARCSESPRNINQMWIFGLKIGN